MSPRRTGLLLLLLLSRVLLFQGRSEEVTWIRTGSVWSFFRGTHEASSPDTTLWRAPEFNSSTWESGPLPLYYGEALTGTLISDMGGRYTTLFLRKTFTVADPADVRALLLRVQVDDGFIAWINGHEVARFAAPAGDPKFNSLASVSATEPVQLQDYPVGAPESVLKPGANVLAIQVFNVSLTSSDIVLDASLSGTVDTDPPRLARLQPVDGAVLSQLTSVEALFSKPVRGVRASDLRINGVPATGLSQAAPDQYVFSFPAVPSGTVTATIPAGTVIIDQSAAARPFAGASWTYTVDTSTPPPGVTISEFLAVNSRGLRDDDGDHSDWIELANSSSDAVSLSGWSLIGNTTVWPFPPVTLSAKGRLLVYASGKNRTNVTAALHTNFKLGSDGERLALISPGGAIAFQYSPAYPPQRADVSYGHAEGAPNRRGYFVVPTPGQPNSTSGEGFAPDVVFSVASGTYVTGTLDLTLTPSTNAPNTAIHYTLDGSLPTELSPVYSGALHFTNLAVQVRARAFATPLLPGTVRSETYIPLSAQVAAFRSDLPIFLIHDFNKGRPPANTRQFAHFQIFEPGTNGFTSLTDPPAVTSRAGISVRGSSTEGLPKASYRVEFRDEFDNDRSVSPLGLPPDGDWVMYAPNSFEPVLIHNPFMHRLSRDIGRYSPRTRFVEVYFAGSGTGPVTQASYAGIYVLEERIEIGKDRVDAGSLQPQNLTLPSVTGGYMMKVDRLDPGDSGLSAANQSMGFVEPAEADLRLPSRAPQMNYIRNYLTGFGNALYDDARFTNRTTGFRAYIHTPSWIDHHLLNVLAFNVDALRLSAYFYKERSGLLHFGPLWDFDRALGSTDGRDSNPRVWRAGNGDGGTDFFNYTWWDRLFRDPDFFQDYIDRYQELRRDQFSTTNLWRLIDELTAQVRSAQPREVARWGVSPRGGSYQAEINIMRAWISNRTEFMDRQFVAPPRVVTPGGPVLRGSGIELAPAPGIPLYYTLDGTDPRLPGGRISPAAIQYTGTPVKILKNAKVVARSMNPSHTALTGPNNPPLKSLWSSPVSATYVTDPIPVVISEIHYNPNDGSAPGDADNLEFIEFLNFGTRPLSFEGMRLRGGVDYDWTATNNAVLRPGERGVLVRNLDRFAVQNPTVSAILGVYGSQQLSNAGERLALFGPLDEPVFDFRYDPAWQPLTDGVGYSLVLADELHPGPLGEGSTWRRSTAVGGSPGQPDADPVYTPGILQASIDAESVVHLTFDAPAGTSHRIESRNQLEVGGWSSAAEFGGAGANRVEELTVRATHAARFYRVLRY
jgi:hypothetical protein